MIWDYTELMSLANRIIFVILRPMHFCISMFVDVENDVNKIRLANLRFVCGRLRRQVR